MSIRQLGPIIGATLVCKNSSEAIESYQEVLGYIVVDENTVSKDMAVLWNSPKLIGNKISVLSSANGDAWLRIIEDPQAKSIVPLKTHGWMALESNVANVDTIRERFVDNLFSIIGEPAYLQVSDAIKAMQVIGPAGEVNYLTQVDRDVPPFELPMTSYETGSLFIPVLCTPNRDISLAFYQQLNNADQGLCFDTKITVLNNAWDRDIEHQYPVATLQLDGKCLFEIDQVEIEQVERSLSAFKNKPSLPAGIALITCEIKNIQQVAERFKVNIHCIKDRYYQGKSAILLQGPAGELIELIG